MTSKKHKTNSKNQSTSVGVEPNVRGDLAAIHIVVKYGYSGSGKYGWWAKCHWQDNKFCEPKTVEGNIRTRYAEQTITDAIDAVMEVVNTFGLKLNKNFALFYEGDGKNTEYPPPEGWKLILQKEAENRHWRERIAPTPSSGRAAFASDERIVRICGTNEINLRY